MEKIQSAIAKARAERAEKAGTVPAQPLPASGIPAQAPAPAAQALPPEAAVTVDPISVSDAWAALPSFTPSAAHLMRHHVVTNEKGKDVAHFDALRTRLLQQMRANNWRRVAITSPRAACGKSTIALNLGFSLARQADVRTLVAEMDLRRPSLAKSLGMRVEHRFSRVLEGTERFEDNVLRYGQNLAFATNHGAVRNPTEILASPRTAAAIADIEARYDPTLIIFDLPPMLMTDDAMAFISQVDCVLLLAAAESTTIKEIDICERDLAAQTNVLGVVLNKCRYMGPEYGYGYY